MKNHKLFDLLAICLLPLIVLFTYRGLFRTFLQQDEWLGLGTVLSGGIFADFLHFSTLQLLSGTERFFGSLINYIVDYYFPFRMDVLAWFALAAHSLNVLLWYNVTLVITKKRLVAFLSALFFAVNFTASQSVSWFASIFTTLPAATFVFISILLFKRYIDTQKLKYLLFTQLFSIVAFLFKESSIFLFFLFPIITVFWKKRQFSYLTILKYFFVYILYACFVIFIRVYFIRGLGSSAGAFVSNSSSMWQKMLLHAFMYPTLSFPQIFIPQQILFKLADGFQKVNYGGMQGFMATQLGVESIVSDFVSLVMAVALFGFVFFVGEKQKHIRPILYLALFFTVMSFLPFIVVDKGNAYLDSRYFYIGSAGGGAVLALLLTGIVSFFQKRQRIVSWFVIVIMSIFCTGYIYKNYQFITRDIQAMVLVSTERKSVLGQVQTLYPHISADTVFYVTGNHYGYYGLQEVKVPFQQGFGYTLMVVYFKSGTIPPALLQEYFLWRIRDQGYRTVGTNGFGYYYDINTLKKAVREGTISPMQVIGLYYDTDAKILRDITSETRTKIAQSP
jgi:hypothetical protein